MSPAMMPFTPFTRALVGLCVLFASLAPGPEAAAAPAGRRRPEAPPMLPVPTEAPPAVPEAATVAALEVPANADVLDFASIVAHARDNAPLVQVARARVEFGDAAIAGQKPLLPDNPTLWLGLGARRNTAGRNFEIQSQLDQRLEVFGERRMRIRAAKRYREQLEKELALVQWANYAEVHAAYNAAVVAKARANTAAGLLGFSARLLEITRRRAQAGEISELRARVAEGEFAQARQAKIAAELEFRLACNRLAEVAGWPKGRVIAPAGDLQVPQKVAEVESFVARALEEHPVMQAQRARISAAEARLAAAKRDRLPEPSVGGFFSREIEPGVAMTPTSVGLATVTIPFPVWRRNQAEIAHAKADLEVARTELGALEYRMGLQIRRAVESVNTAADRVSTYAREVVPRFEENLSMLQRAFELGEVDIIEVFVARERFLSIQTEALAAYDSYFRSIYDFESTAGAPLAGATSSAP